MDGAADVLKSLPVEHHHIFDLVHFILCIQAERNDLAEGFETTSRIHPLACWTSAMMACFAGGLLVNPLCGEPVLAALGDSVKLAMATVVWFVLYYCPQDLAFQFSKIFPVRIVLYLIKALYYPKKVLAGMKHAGHVLPGNFMGHLYLTFELLHHLFATLFTLSFCSSIKSLLELRDFQILSSRLFQSQF